MTTLVELGKKRMTLRGKGNSYDENNRTSHTDAQAGMHAEPQVEPTLRGLLEQPKASCRRTSDLRLFGRALLVIVARFSAPLQENARAAGRSERQPPQPTLQDNTDNNVQDMKEPGAAERQKEQQGCKHRRRCARPGLASATPAPTGGRRGLCPSGEAPTSCVQVALRASAARHHAAATTPAQEQAQLIAAKERERADNSRFASNLCTPVLPSNSHSSRSPKSDDALQYDHTTPDEDEFR